MQWRRFSWAAIVIICVAAVFSPVSADSVFAPLVGEKLVYRIYVLGIPLGEQTMTVKSGGMLNGRPTLLIEQRLDSTSFLVNYHEYHSLTWDSGRAVPLMEEVFISEGRGEKQQTKYEFRSEGERLLISRSGSDGSVSISEFRCALGTQTSGSLLLFLRTFPWERGMTRLPLLESSGTQWYSFVVDRDDRTVKVPFGRFSDTYHLRNAELDYDIWFDRGPGHLPLEIRSKLSFGAAVAKLIEAVGYK